ncbi:MAG: SDR family oxidoreductase [Janthinobacterium lividum]
MKLEQRTILITGGTSGIGFELARQLIARRNTVIITGRDQQKLKEAQSALPRIQTIQSDASKPEAIKALLQRVKAEFPTCDTLINNAGIMRNLNLNDPRSLTDLTCEIDINLNGPVQMVQEFLPHLKSRPNALIVNVSSGLAFIPFPLSPVYSAAKAGIHAFTRCLRVQLKGSNVTVVELAPPLVETKLGGGEFVTAMKGQKGMAVDVLVHKAIAGIEAGKTEIRPGLSNVLYLMSRLVPSLPFGQMAKMVRAAS